VNETIHSQGLAVVRIDDLGDGIRCIGLDRAAKRNAIGVDLTLALEAALLAARDDRALKAVVVHGIGGHFSAGMDMKDFFAGGTRPPDVLQRARQATEHWRALARELPQTLVCAVQGYCFGGVLPLLHGADFVVADRSARFGLPEINFGLVPGAQIVKAVAASMSPRGAAYAALSGRNFDADRAKAWGLVTEVVEADPLARALELARNAALATASGLG
jgi:trans-feruloyl-CoA hydratase/vanillin synthase